MKTIASDVPGAAARYAAPGSYRFEGNQWLIEPSPQLGYEVTVESILRVGPGGWNPTVYSLPIGPTWKWPYAVFRLGFFGESARPEFQVTTSGVLITVQFSHELPWQELVHIAGVYDSASIVLYVNGAEAVRRDAPGVLARTSEAACFGARSTTDPGGGLVGAVKECRLFTVARTPEEIAARCESLVPMNERGLLLRYRADASLLVDQNGKISG